MMLIAAAIIITVTTVATVKTQRNVQELKLNTERQLQEVKDLQESKVKSQNNQLKELQQSGEVKEKTIQELNTKLESKVKAKELQIQLASVKVPVAAPKPVTQPAPVAVAGNKASWLTAAGIPPSMWGHVDSIVTRESGWNPNAVNRTSGACGLGQQLPCGKWAGAWNDPVAALRAMTGYVNARYGGWSGAVAFWNANSWY